VNDNRPPRWHLGLRARVTAVFAGLALALSVTLSLASYELTRAFLVNQRSDAARQGAFLNARAVRDALRVDPTDVQGALAEAPSAADNAIVLRVGDSWFGTSVGGRGDVPPSLRTLVSEGSAGTQRTTVSSQPTVAVGISLPAIDGAYFELVRLSELDRTLNRLAQALGIAAILITVLGAVVGRYASGRVLRPVRRMAAAAAEISDGALDERLDADDDSDLEPFVDAFNEMVSALHGRIEREAQFASDVSHELRTPLAKMSAALSVARRRRQSIEAADAALDVLDLELQRFTGLVLDLLDISRMEAGVAELDLEEGEPGELVRSIVASTSQPRVPIRVEPSAPPKVRIDRRRVGQVLTNLLDNAESYAGGAVAVVVAGTSESLLLAVDDAGPGIRPDEREYVFDRFARGRMSGDAPGTGLGLALVVEHVPTAPGRGLGRGRPNRWRPIRRLHPEVDTMIQHRRQFLALLLTGIAVTAGAACGVRSEPVAQPVDDSDVPFQLLDENTGVERAEETGDQDTVVYLARGGRLVRTRRSLPPPITPTSLLRALRLGPTELEATAGIRTALPEDEAASSVRLTGGLATVDLTDAFIELPTGDQVLALAQIVYTFTERPGVGQVQFTLDGDAAEIPRPDGTLTSAPVSRDDYAALDPPG